MTTEVEEIRIVLKDGSEPDPELVRTMAAMAAHIWATSREAIVKRANEMLLDEMLWGTPLTEDDFDWE